MQDAEQLITGVARLIGWAWMKQRDRTFARLVIYVSPSRPTTLFATLNVLYGKVIAQRQPHHRHSEWLTFLHQIDRETPKDKTLHLICGNYATHKTPKCGVAEETPAFRHPFHSDLCIMAEYVVERFFRDLTSECLRCGVFTRVPQLISAIEAYIEQHNENPKPFVWTAKANDILQEVIHANHRLSTKQNGVLH